MLKLIARKLIQGVLMIFIVSAITFALLSSAGGDALTALRDNPQISEETIEKLRQVYGLDRPVTVRYANWLGDLMSGEMGESFYFKTPVRDLVFRRLLNTLMLALIALSTALAVAGSLSFLAARFNSKTLNYAIEFLILITASAPRIVLALSALAITVSISNSAFAANSFALMLIASIVLASPLIAVFLAQMNSELTRAMGEDFVQLARAKGLSESVVITKHASRAALNPVLTILGLSLGGLVGGSVIVETILGWPGLGALMVAAVRARDVPLVMGIVVIASAAVWLGNSLAEVLQLLNDKRMRDAERL